MKKQNGFVILTKNHDRWTRENEIMMRKRFDIQMTEWTSIYIALAQCTETSHPTLHEEMYECCRLDDRGVPGAYDAPMAWQFVLDSLTVTTRSKEDKKYYARLADVSCESKHRVAVSSGRGEHAQLNPSTVRGRSDSHAGLISRGGSSQGGRAILLNSPV